MAKRCGLRRVRLVKKLKNIRVLDDGDYLSDVVRVSEGVEEGKISG